MFDRILARQLRRPRGLGGRLVMRFMNNVNEAMNRVTVQQMQIAPTHRVLDVGFGGGIALGLMARRADRGLVVGVEMSATALARARRVFAEPISRGRMLLVKGSIDRLPCDEACFDRICSVNTLYFGTDTPAELRQLYRLLKDDGRLVLSFRPPRDMRKLSCTRYGFRLLDEETVASLLRQAKFEDVQLHQQRDGELGFVCASARKPVDELQYKKPALTTESTKATKQKNRHLSA